MQLTSEAGPQKRQEILDWLPDLNGHLDRLGHTLTAARATLRCLLAGRDVTQGRVSQAAREATQAVRQQEDELKGRVERAYETRIQRQGRRERAASVAIEALTSLRESLEVVVMEGDAELLRQAPSLTQRYDGVMRSVGGEGGGEGGEEGEAFEAETETFVAAWRSDLQSAVLVGRFHSGTVEVRSCSFLSFFRRSSIGGV